MNRTPDVRTCVFARWCSEVTIKYCTPTLTHEELFLCYQSGMICGLGDNRQEKATVRMVLILSKCRGYGRC